MNLRNHSITFTSEQLEVIGKALLNIKAKHANPVIHTINTQLAAARKIAEDAEAANKKLVDEEIKAATPQPE